MLLRDTTLEDQLSSSNSGHPLMFWGSGGCFWVRAADPKEMTSPIASPQPHHVH